MHRQRPVIYSISIRKPTCRWYLMVNQIKLQIDLFKALVTHNFSLLNTLLTTVFKFLKSDNILIFHITRDRIRQDPLPGGYSTLSWGTDVRPGTFDHHPITKPEKTQICDLCLNHLFLEGPFFFKPISTFYLC